MARMSAHARWLTVFLLGWAVLRDPALLQGAEQRATAAAGSVDMRRPAEAAHGDLVLLTYFNAIGEQIQQAAEGRTWVTGAPQGGLVQVAFTLRANGDVEDIAVLGAPTERSAHLRGLAVRILRRAAPFPPFPSSMREASRTVVVPLEFLLGT